MGVHGNTAAKENYLLKWMARLVDYWTEDQIVTSLEMLLICLIPGKYNFI